MASVFGHGLVAYTVTKVADSKSSKLLVFLAIVSSILPDLDVIGFSFGIEYLHPLGHRGFTHSILFALLWSGLLAFFFGKSRQLVFAVVLFLSTVSHGVLDAMTVEVKVLVFLFLLITPDIFFLLERLKYHQLELKNSFQNGELEWF